MKIRSNVLICVTGHFRLVMDWLRAKMGEHSSVCFTACRCLKAVTGSWSYYAICIMYFALIQQASLISGCSVQFMLIPLSSNISITSTKCPGAFFPTFSSADSPSLPYLLILLSSLCAFCLKSTAATAWLIRNCLRLILIFGSKIFRYCYIT